jgi:hypothetical protein
MTDNEILATYPIGAVVTLRAASWYDSGIRPTRPATVLGYEVATYKNKSRIWCIRVRDETNGATVRMLVSKSVIRSRRDRNAVKRVGRDLPIAVERWQLYQDSPSSWSWLDLANASHSTLSGDGSGFVLGRSVKQ